MKYLVCYSLRSRCQKGIKCVRSLEEETPPEEEGEGAGEGRESLQTTVWV